MAQSLEARVTGLEHDMENIQEATREMKEQQTEIIKKQDLMHKENSGRLSDIEKKLAWGAGGLAVLMGVLKLPELISWIVGKH